MSEALSIEAVRKYPVSLEEALRRVSEKAMVRVLFQSLDKPDEPIEERYVYRDEIERILHGAPLIEESGALAQKDNMGLHVFMFRKETSEKGMLFIETKPECQVSPEELRRKEEALADDLLATHSPAEILQIIIDASKMP